MNRLRWPFLYSSCALVALGLLASADPSLAASAAKGRSRAPRLQDLSPAAMAARAQRDLATSGDRLQALEGDWESLLARVRESHGETAPLVEEMDRLHTQTANEVPALVSRLVALQRYGAPIDVGRVMEQQGRIRKLSEETGKRLRQRMEAEAGETPAAAPPTQEAGTRPVTSSRPALVGAPVGTFASHAGVVATATPSGRAAARTPVASERPERGPVKGAAREVQGETPVSNAPVAVTDVAPSRGPLPLGPPAPLPPSEGLIGSGPTTVPGAPDPSVLKRWQRPQDNDPRRKSVAARTPSRAAKGLKATRRPALRAASAVGQSGPQRAPGTSTISGTITAELGGPVDSGDVCATVVSTGETMCAGIDADGTYTIAGIAGDSYYVLAQGGGRYVWELYGGPGVGIACPMGGCDRSAGEAVSIFEGDSATVDLALAEGGRISGALTEDVGSTALAGQIGLFDHRGNWLGQIDTDGAGLYTTVGLPAATYFVRATASTYISEFYGDYVCGGDCGGTKGTPVTVSIGADTGSVSMALHPGATISGTVTSGATPLSGGWVGVRDATGGVLGSAQADGSGNYTITGLPPGQYSVAAEGFGSHLNQVYNGTSNVNCLLWECGWDTAAMVVVGDRTSTTGINFSLTAGGQITGTVTDASNGAAVSWGGIEIYDQYGVRLGSLWMNGNSSFTTPGLPEGPYYAVAKRFRGYADQLYNGLPCGAGCNVAGGTPIEVTVGGTTTANFPLGPGGGITGTVTEAATGNLLVDGIVDVYTLDGWWVGDAHTNASGIYSLQGMATGQYYVWARQFPGHVAELYPNAVCIEMFGGWCDPNTGQTVSVTNNVLSTGIDFVLDRGGSFSGTVTDAGVGVPLTGNGGSAYLDIADRRTQRWISRSFPTSETGAYTSPALPPGDYTAVFRVGGFIRQAYSADSCGACDPSSGTPIAIAAGVNRTNTDFQMVRGATITGQVTSQATGVPLGHGQIEVRDSQGRYWQEGWWPEARLDGQGRYTITGLAPGVDFYVNTRQFNPFVDEIWDNQVCAGGRCGIAGATPITVTGLGTISDVNFALTMGGAISGSLTDSDTGAPISNSWTWGGYVRVHDASGQFVGEDWPDDNGRYVVGGLPAGNHYVVARARNRVSETYNDVMCAGCNAPQVNGNAVPVNLGETTPLIDFQLARGGTIRGHVTDALSSLALTGGQIELWRGSEGLGQYSVDSAGELVINGLMPGVYYARAYGFVGHVDAVYDDIACPNRQCDYRGTPIVISAAETVTGIDFALEPGARIEGRVTRASDGAGLSNGWLDLRESHGWHRGSYWPDAEGYYSITGLAAGTYYVYTRGFTPYVDEIFNGLPCPGSSCGITGATPIFVPLGGAAAGINFVLDEGGAISGQLTRDEDGQPINYGQIEVYDASGSYAGWGSTDDLGNYTTTGLPAGAYFVVARAEGRAAELYGYATPCFSCRDPQLSGTAVSVSLGVTRTGVNLQLGPGAMIQGQVTEAATGLPLTGTGVRIADVTGWSLWANMDNLGNYTFNQLPAGSYYVGTNNSSPLVDEMYDNIPCPNGNCDWNAGTPVTVGAPPAVVTINFALERGGSITGQVTDANTGLPLTGGAVEAFTTTSGYGMGWYTVDALGNYRIDGLAAGTYTLRTRDFVPFVDEQYNNRVCPDGHCDPRTGTPVTVAPQGTTTGVNFALDRGGSISGRVTDGSTGLTGGSVEVMAADGSGLGWYAVRSTGDYTISGLPAGTYFLRTRDFGSYVDEQYANTPCPHGSCSSNLGTPVVLAAEQDLTGIDFVLALGGRISGQISASDTGLPLASGQVGVVDVATGRWIWDSSVNGLGQFVVDGLPAGDYVVRTNNFWPYIDKQHSGQTCPNGGCDWRNGTLVPLSPQGAVTGINFTLERGGTLSGHVSDGLGQPLTSGYVEAINNTGQGVGGSRWNGTEWRISGLPEGNYYVRTRNSGAFVDELYNNIPCSRGGCSPQSGTPVALASQGTTSNINFVLAPGASISGAVTDADTGLPLTGGRIDLWDGSGRGLGGYSVDGNGQYTIEGLAAGAYYARASDFGTYVTEAYNDVACPRANCNYSVGAPIPVAEGANVTGISFALVAGGSLSGRVANESGTSLTSGAVGCYSASGQFVTSVGVRADGTYELTGLPAGQYRVQASSPGHVNEVYNNITPGSDVMAGVTVTVTQGGATTGIDFSLMLAVVITGRVVDGSGTPLANIDMRLYDNTNAQRASTRTTSAGAYRFDTALGGTYFVVAVPTNHVCEIYQEVVCVGHQATQGTPIVLADGEQRVLPDLSVATGGSIEGDMVEAGTGAPITNGSVSVSSVPGGIVSSWSASTDATGHFRTGTALPTGSYTVQGSAPRHITILYDSIQWSPNNAVLDADPVAVSVGQATTDVDFALPAGGTFSGKVLSASTRTVVPGNVIVWNPADDSSPGGIWVDQWAGTSYTTMGVPAGEYRVSFAQWSGGSDYVDQLYDGITCEGWAAPCGLNRGVPIVVALGQDTAGTDMNILDGGHISGTVTGNGSPLPNTGIVIYDPAGHHVGRAATGPDGRYTTQALAPGNYYLITQNDRGFHDEAYGGNPCSFASCATTGTPVSVAVHATTNPIDFELGAGVGITGTVTRDAGNATNLPITMYLYDGTGARIDTSSAPIQVRADGTYGTPALPDGTYYLMAESGRYVAEVWDNVSCLMIWARTLCDVTRGTPIVVSGGVPTPAVANFDLSLTRVSIDDVVRPEGDGGTANATFTVTLSAPIAYWARIQYTTNPGSAAAGSDYQAVTGDLLFAPGETSKTIAVPILGDTTEEPSETFVVTLTDARNAVIAKGVGTGTIVNDDGATTISFASAAYLVNEGAGHVAVAVQRTGNMLAGPTVIYGTEPGSATAGLDYTTTSGTLTFGLNVGALTFDVPILADAVFDPAEQFVVNLSSPTGAGLGSPASTTVTIAEAGQIQLGSATYSVGEGAGPLTVTVTRTGGTTAGVTIHYATADVSATGGSDYTATNGTLTFGADETEQTFTVPITNDALFDPSETFSITLSAPSGGASLGTVSTATVTIRDDEQRVELVSPPPQVSESSPSALATVRRSGDDLSLPLTVDYATSVGGTATPGADYTPSNGSLTFAGSDLEQSFNVPITPDTVDENDETVNLVLSNASAGGVIATPTAVLTILDDDTAGTLQFDATVAGVGEAAGAVVLQVQRYSGAASGVTVEYVTQDVTATAGADYTLASGTLTFDANEMVKTVTVTINNDSLFDPTESFRVNLLNPGGGGTLGTPGTATVTIRDDEQQVAFVGAPYQVAENAGAATITVRRSGDDLGGTLTVDFATSDGTATVADSDYTAANGTLTFASGAATQTLGISIADDTVAEGNETINLTLSNVSAGGQIPSPTTTLTILDDDAAGTLQLGAATYSLSEGVGTASIPVIRTAGAASGVTVHFETSDGTATVADNDYTAQSGTLSFGLGDTQAMISVPITSDARIEPDETFNVTLSDPQGGATLGPVTSAVVTLVDDDLGGTLQLGAATYSVGEASGSLTVTVTRTGGAASGVKVRYDTYNLTASPSSDYMVTGGVLTFGVDETEKTFTVPIINDTVYDPSETFGLTLGLEPGCGCSLGTPSIATVTIRDDEQLVEFVSPSSQVVENVGAAAIGVRRSGDDLMGTLTVDYANVAGGSATLGADYAATSGTLTFGPNEAEETFSVPITDDTADEGDETISLMLWNASSGGIVATPGTTLTISDDDTAGTIMLAAPTYSFSEGVGTSAILVGRLGGAAGGVTVHYETSDETATVADNDYTATSGTLTFGPNQTEATIHVPITSDCTIEGDQSLRVTLSLPQGGATLGTTFAASVMLTNDDSAGVFQLSSLGFEVSEGDGNALVYVARTGGAACGITVSYETTTGGSATEGADYTTTSGTLTFGENETARPFAVPILNDTEGESNETIQLLLTDAQGGGTLGPQTTAVLTIQDNEQLVQLSAATSTVAEGGTATITVRRAGLMTGTCSVDYEVTGNSATAGDDFTASAGPLVFGAGVTQRTFSVPTVNDTLDEDNETVNVVLKNPSGCALGTIGAALLTITDNDTAGTVQFSAATYAVGEGGGLAHITVTRSGGTASGATIDYTTSDFTTEGHATVDADYTLTSGTLTFAAGQTSLALDVPILDDAEPEGHETVSLTLTNPRNGFVVGTRSAATLTIQDDEPTVGFLLPEQTLTEGGTFQVKVQKTGPLTNAVTVNYATSDGPAPNGASAGLDYTAKLGTLTIPAGQAAGTITVATRQDTLDEADETILVTLSGATGASLGMETTTLLIRNNDSAGVIQFRLAEFTVSEASANATITVTRASGTAGGVTVDYTVSDGTAANHEDFEWPAPETRTLTFAAGQTSLTFTIPIINDTDFEPAETINLALTNQTGSAELGALSTATLSILDNDGPHFQFSTGSYQVGEATSVATITVRRTGGLNTVATVEYTIAGDSATAGADYGGPDLGQLTFNSGVASRTFTIPIINDTRDEDNEIVNLALQNPSGGSLLGAPAEAVLTIRDNDTAGRMQFSTTSYSRAEGVNGSRVVYNLMVTRTNGTASDVTVDFGLDESAPGTATVGADCTSGVDYVLPPSPLTFAYNERGRPIAVTICGDGVLEPNESVRLKLTGAGGGGTVGTPTSATLWIVNRQ